MAWANLAKAVYFSTILKGESAGDAGLGQQIVTLRVNTIACGRSMPWKKANFPQAGPPF